MAVKKGAEFAASPAILNLCNSIAIAAISAPCVLFLELCFRKGMIFRKYRALVGYWFQFKPRRRILRNCLTRSFSDRALAFKHGGQFTSLRGSSRLAILAPPRWWSWFFKPLGGCVYCFGAWIALAAFMATAPAVSLSSGLILAGVLGWNYIFIDLYQKFKTRFE